MTNKSVKVCDKNGRIIYEGQNRRMNGNGNGKLVFYLLTVTVAIVIAFATAWAGGVQRKINEYDNLIISRGDRLTALEISFKYISDKLLNIDSNLKNLDNNVNTVIKELAVEKIRKVK